MTRIKIRQDWEISENEVTPESTYLNRRQFLKRTGFAGVGTLALINGCAWAKNGGVEKQLGEFQAQKIEVSRNAAFTVNSPITDEVTAASYNNFYEFSYHKNRVWKLVEKFQTRPWEVEVTGLVENPRTYDLDDLMKMMPTEERVYRFRCVEAWAMVVPWVGFPMRALIDQVKPKSSAKYVRMLTFFRPDEAPQQQGRSNRPWPYFEGLTMAEAINELTLLVTGIYGHVLPKQHGAPIRLIVPWKYGFKSIKSIVSIEFTDRKPRTFWNTLAPREYDFLANVNPEVPHPRWSQAVERMIDTGDRQKTTLYNGYGSYVADLYKT